MKKIAVIVLIAIFCLLSAWAGASASKAAANGKYVYFAEHSGEEVYVDTALPAMTYRFSDMPSNGKIPAVALSAEGNRFIDAIVIEQYARKSNTWEVKEHGDYYLSCYYSIISIEGNEVESGSFWREIKDPDNIRPVRSIEMKITEAEDEGKLYDYREMPYEEYYITYQLFADGEPVFDEEAPSKSFTLDFYPEHEEEENRRPYLYDTVKLTKGGKLAFVHDDQDEYFYPTGKMYNRYYYRTVFGSFIDMHRSEFEYSVTEKGQRLFDSLLGKLIDDEALATDEFKTLRKEMKEQEIGSVLGIFSSTTGMGKIIQELRKYFEYASKSFLNYLDMDKVNEYSYRGNLWFPATEEEYLEYYSEENRGLPLK